MSYILDALKKSERERLAGTIPSVGNLMLTNGPSRRTGWMVSVIIVVLVGMFGGISIGMNRKNLHPAVPVPSADLQIIQVDNVKSLPPSGSPTNVPVVALPATTIPPSELASAKAPVIAPFSTDEVGTTYKEIWHAKVAGIIDGCTIEIKTQQNEIRKVRFADIVCLPFQSLAGKEARLFTTRSIFVQDVIVAIIGEDARLLIADVLDRDTILLNRTLVQQGLVNATGTRFRRDEEHARTRKKGLWQNPTIWLHAP